MNMQQSLAAIACQIKKRRADVGITQTALAELAGLSQSCVAKIECGQPVTLQSLILIGDALDADCHMVAR
tara:strand:- start:32 stop:241 length:210 start_codon:yes stop_codon:yes gene_type:complete